LRVALIFVFGLTATLYGQSGYVIQGGDSTLMQTMGMQGKMTFANGSETAAGVGILSGHVYGGATESMSYRGLNVKAGDLQIPFGLLTDARSMGFPAIGVEASKGDTKSDTQWTAFAGATSVQVSTPYFFGGRTSEATAAFFLTHKISPSWTFQSSEVVAEKETAIEEIQFNPILYAKTFTAALGGGIGSDSPFAACRVSYKDLHFAGTANYTERSPNFHRIILPYATVNENEGLNANGTFTSQHFGAAFSHSTTESNLSPTKTVQSTGTSLGMNAQASIFSVNASDYLSKSQGLTSTGQSAGISMTSPWFSASASVYHAKKTFASGTLIEHLTQRISVSEFIEKDAVNVGGAISGNTVSLSAGYQMVYLPITGTFTKTFVANVTIQLPNAITMQGSTLTTPDGKTRYSIGSTKYGAGAEQKQADVSGKILYSGAVVDIDGRPVAGAAILLGEGKAQVEVFSAHDGVFRMPAKKNRTLPVAVALNDFMTAGHWRVVRCPESMTALEHVQIVVSIVDP
jgi:hypothetical protein